MESKRFFTVALYSLALVLGTALTVLNFMKEVQHTSLIQEHKSKETSHWKQLLESCVASLQADVFATQDAQGKTYCISKKGRAYLLTPS